MFEIVTRDFTGKDSQSGSETMYDPATNVNIVNPHGMVTTDYVNL